MTDNSDTLVLRVSLDGVEPEIWRTIEVADVGTLGDLHGVVVGAMGWDDSHLHSFMVDEKWYSPVYESMESVGDDEESVAISEALPEVGSTIRWMYDWGDGWNHTITVEKTGTMQKGTTYPILHDGARACPPEDCGGPPGYADMRDFVPLDYDPEHFDVAETDVDMRSERPLEGW